jgi:transposase
VLGVHKAQIIACVRVPGPDHVRVEHVKELKTTAGGLLVLRDWLEANRVTRVKMEATGVYWKPVCMCRKMISSRCWSTLSA